MINFLKHKFNVEEKAIIEMLKLYFVRETKPKPYYHYSNRIQLCKDTDFNKFLTAIIKGHVYYDPAPRITKEGKQKKRSMFRTKTTHLPSLYEKHEIVDTLNPFA